MSGNKNVFASKVGAILAAAGSAVGLGNVWRFPTEVGTNGGAAFILIYVLFMLVLGVPIMVTEFAIGRHGGSDVTDAFQKMGGGRRGWKWMGLIPVVSGFLILSYYAVVAGWTLYYAYEALMGGFSGKSPEEFTNDFIAFSSSSWTPVFWMVIIIAMTCGSENHDATPVRLHPCVGGVLTHLAQRKPRIVVPLSARLFQSDQFCLAQCDGTGILLA